MKLHELKIKMQYYNAIKNGEKTFEIRKNDRDYQVADLINFKVIMDFEDGDISLLNTGEVYQITYVLKNVPEYGLDKDYCILGIKRLVRE